MMRKRCIVNCFIISLVLQCICAGAADLDKKELLNWAVNNYNQINNGKIIYEMQVEMEPMCDSIESASLKAKELEEESLRVFKELHEQGKLSDDVLAEALEKSKLAYENNIIGFMKPGYVKLDPCEFTFFGRNHNLLRRINNRDESESIMNTPDLKLVWVSKTINDHSAKMHKHRNYDRSNEIFFCHETILNDIYKLEILSKQIDGDAVIYELKHKKGYPETYKKVRFKIDINTGFLEYFHKEYDSVLIETHYDDYTYFLPEFAFPKTFSVVYHEKKDQDWKQTSLESIIIKSFALNVGITPENCILELPDTLEVKIIN